MEDGRQSLSTKEDGRWSQWGRREVVSVGKTRCGHCIPGKIGGGFSREDGGGLSREDGRLVTVFQGSWEVSYS